jgi:hypothetical protein
VSADLELEFRAIVEQIVDASESIPDELIDENIEQLLNEKLEAVSRAAACSICPRGFLRKVIGPQVCGDHKYTSLEEGHEAAMAVLAILGNLGQDEN